MVPLDELLPLVAEPREDLAAEYKGWLDLTETNHKAVLAKAAIAIANHGGGYIIIGCAMTAHSSCRCHVPSISPPRLRTQSMLRSNGSQRQSFIVRSTLCNTLKLALPIPLSWSPAV